MPRRIKGERNGVELVCTISGCGKRYYASVSKAARGSLYCSIECRTIGRTVWKTCAQCGRQNVRGQDTYCSSECVQMAFQERRETGAMKSRAKAASNVLVQPFGRR